MKCEGEEFDSVVGGLWLVVSGVAVAGVLAACAVRIETQEEWGIDCNGRVKAHSQSLSTTDWRYGEPVPDRPDGSTPD